MKMPVVPSANVFQDMQEQFQEQFQKQTEQLMASLGLKR
jgi:hypothetical protein